MHRILIQFDTDAAPSVFDRVVAVDADCDDVFSYGGVTPENVVPLVHGAIFTRGPDDLKNTAIFVGGSDVQLGERVCEQIGETFFGPMRCSVLMDSNGSNTTAAAAVLSAAKHVSLKGTHALVLGGTGPVGLRAAQLLVLEGADVLLASRRQSKAEEACRRLRETVSEGAIAPLEWDASRPPLEICQQTQVVIAAGAAGAELLSEASLSQLTNLKVAIDLNAVPPAGIAGIKVGDKAKERNGRTCYGAIGVGGLKMKIHKAAIKKLFESNDHMLETIQIYKLGQSLV